MRFINRERELASLEKEYAASRFSFVIIYGRRRLGKTRLIQEFVQDKNALYFLADTQADMLDSGLLAGRTIRYALFSKSGFTNDMIQTAEKQDIALFT